MMRSLPLIRADAICAYSFSSSFIFLMMSYMFSDEKRKSAQLTEQSIAPSKFPCICLYTKQAPIIIVQMTTKAKTK